LHLNYRFIGKLKEMRGIGEEIANVDRKIYDF
jgi:hypothetical protein